MRNFNTYQTRNFYVAKAIDTSLDTPCDIALKTTATGEMFFSYKNADGLLTRSDMFKPENISHLNLKGADDMNTPLMMYKITASPVSGWVGKTLTLNIDVREILSYDSSDSITITASVVGDATNTATAAAFYKDLAKAIVTAMPKRTYPFFKVFMNKTTTYTEITKDTADGSYMADATSVIIVQAPQKWVRGKLTAEPFGLSVSSSLRGSNVDYEAWAEVKEEASTVTDNISIPSAYDLADLEYFALGERGDIYRGSIWPNEYNPTYVINPLDSTVKYNVLSIEFFWQGSAENVQKSPRMIQVVAPATLSNDVATTLYDLVDAARNGVAFS